MTQHPTVSSLTTIKHEAPSALGRSLRRVLLGGTVMAGVGAMLAITPGPKALAQEFNFYASCPNSSFCSALPPSNWRWSAGLPGTSFEVLPYIDPTQWSRLDASGNPTPVPGHPNSDSAVIVIPGYISAVLGPFAVKAYSWTLVGDMTGSAILGGAVEFTEGGGIFSSSSNLRIDDVKITGAGGIYLFPDDVRLESISGGPLIYNLSISGSNNSYSGPTELTGASLFIEGGGAIGDASAVRIAGTQGLLFLLHQSETIGSLSGGGQVALGGSLTTGGNGLSTTYAGAISGGGALIKTGAGTFTLTGANNYTGGTEVSAGTLVGSAASIPGAIANAATVVFNQAADATFGGNVSGLGGVAGQMVKQGAGVLTLTGTSTLDWSVAAGGLVSVSDRFSGDLALAAGTSFTFDQTYAGTYAGEITGAGDVAFVGGGVVTLTGESTAHSGTSMVSGHLSVNGTHSGQVAVASGGTLSGNGSTGNVTVAAGGIVAPGNSIGTLAVKSDLAFAAGSTYRVEVDGDSGADRLDVAGTATLNGSDIYLILDASESYRDGGRYEILRAGAVRGRFAPVDLASAFLSPGLGYTATDVTLTLAPVAAPGEPLFATVAEASNQRAVATALDGLDQTDGSEALALYNAVLFSGADDARAAFDQLSGEIAASVATALIEDSRHVRNAMTDRLAAAFAVPETASATSGPGEAARMGETGAEGWIGGYGSWGESDGDGNAAGLDRDAQGLLVGLDGPVLGDMRIGLLAGYGSSSVDTPARVSSADIDSYHVGLYGGAAFGRLDLAAGAAYSRNEIDTTRAIGLAGFADALSTDFDSGTAQVFGEASTRIDLGSAGIAPFANLSYVSIDADGHSETGGAAALAISGGTNDATFSTLGLRASTVLPLGSADITAKVMLGWRHAYGDATPHAALRLAGGNAFSIDGVPIAEDAAIVDLGLAVAIAPQASLGLHYAGQFASDARDDGVTARLDILF